jgi:hypothetical protein
MPDIATQKNDGPNIGLERKLIPCCREAVSPAPQFSSRSQEPHHEFIHQRIDIWYCQELARS